VAARIYKIDEWMDFPRSWCYFESPFHRHSSIDMGKLTCPNCNGRLIANPVGRWYAKFKCAHCGAPLQFSSLTNVLGMTGSVLFTITIVILIVHGYDKIGGRLLLLGVGGWLILLFLSYSLRGVVRDEKK